MTIHNPVVKIKDGLVGKEVDTSLILATEASDMSNVIKWTDAIGQRPGRVAYGSGSGIVMKYYHFKVGDTNRFLKFTDTKIYRRTGSGWSDISGTNLGGGIDYFVDACTVWDDDAGSFYVVFTNGKDLIRKYDGTNDTSNMSAWTSYLARFVRYYQGYLVCANLTYSGVRYGFRFRCSHTDNPNDTTSANSKNFNMTKDKNISDIMKVEHFGNFLAFYKTDCIYGAWLGSTKNIFEFDVWVHKTGLRASRALSVGADGSHFFLGNDDFYYWANRSSLPQGLASRKVKKRIFEDTDPNSLNRAVTVYDARHNHIKLYVPTTHYLDIIYDLDLNDGKWTWWKSTRSNLTAVGSYDRDIIITIDELTGTIDELTGTIDELSGDKIDNFPVIIEGDKDGNSFYDSDTAYNDGSTAIDSYSATGDDIFTSGEVPFTYERIQGIKIEAKGKQDSGDRLYIWYSTDEGTTWTAITSGIDKNGTVWNNYISLTTEWEWYKCYFDIVANKIRYKFSNAIAGSTWAVRKLDKLQEEREK